MRDPREFTARLFRSLPSFKGKTRAIRILNACYNRLGLPSLVPAQLRTGGTLVLDLRSRTELVPYYLGDYDGPVIRQLARLFGEGWTVLDVGANIGFYAVPFALRLRGLGGRLLCFEPVPSNFDRLRENLRVNALEPVAAAERLALSDRPGTLKMTLREDFAGGGGTGNASVLIEDGKDASFEAVDVPAMRLDDFVAERGIARVDFIKVDIEGHEGDFLRGARGAIARFRPIILSEFNEDYLRRKGEDVDALCEEVFSGLDYVYLRKGAEGAWKAVSTLKGRVNTDDALLVPRERLSEALRGMAGEE